MFPSVGFTPLGKEPPKDKCYCDENSLCPSHQFMFNRMLVRLEECATIQLMDISYFIEPHMLGATGRWMNGREIIEHIKFLETKLEEAHEKLDALGVSY